METDAAVTAAPVSPRPARQAIGPGARVAAWTGLALHLGAGVVPYSGSGLVAPRWGAVLLWLSWAVLLCGWVIAHRTRPWIAAAVPVVGLVWWVAVVTAGDLAAGWTA